MGNPFQLSLLWLIVFITEDLEMSSRNR